MAQDSTASIGALAASHVATACMRAAAARCLPHEFADPELLCLVATACWARAAFSSGLAFDSRSYGGSAASSSLFSAQSSSGMRCAVKTVGDPGALLGVVQLLGYSNRSSEHAVRERPRSKLH
ncbi:hypothetical protein ON010_g5381 [Phytophthora cinnamomi]|nr:hypothetical protein ON010_g5381 [Phytophthora cinnamomi]